MTNLAKRRVRSRMQEGKRVAKWQNEIILDEKFKMITKKGNIPVYVATFYSGTKRLMFEYFSAQYSMKDIAVKMNELLHKKYPNLQKMIDEGKSIVEFEIQRG